MPRATASWVDHYTDDENPPEYQPGDIVTLYPRNIELLDLVGLVSVHARVIRVFEGGRYGECTGACCHRYQVEITRVARACTYDAPTVESISVDVTQIAGRSDMPVDEYSETVSRIRETFRVARLQHLAEIENRFAHVNWGSWYTVRPEAGLCLDALFRAEDRSREDSVSGVLATGNGRFQQFYTLLLRHLGEPVSGWRVPDFMPQELSVGNVRFATTVSNNDIVAITHEMPEGRDPDTIEPRHVARFIELEREEREVHECDDGCYDYGCPNEDDDDDYGSSSSLVHNYSYTPVLDFRGEGHLFLGVELELATPYADVSAVAYDAHEELGDLIYLKEDCSIRPRGFEMVHHPMSYDWAYQNYPREALRHLRASGAYPDSSCGMHVHVSRNGFANSVHTFKWMRWFYRNQKEVKILARRRSDEFATFDNNINLTKYVRHVAKGAYGAERYSAINCGNRHTLEVRVFASTLNIQKFLGALALVDASVRYNNTITSGDVIRDGAWEFPAFKEYVHSFKKYAPLQREMARLSL